MMDTESWQLSRGWDVPEWQTAAARDETLNAFNHKSVRKAGLYQSAFVMLCLLLPWLGLAWLGLAWLGLAWLGLVGPAPH